MSCINHNLLLNEWYNINFEGMKADILGLSYRCLKFTTETHRNHKHLTSFTVKPTCAQSYLIYQIHIIIIRDKKIMAFELLIL